jgi:hypothetical protein
MQQARFSARQVGFNGAVPFQFYGVAPVVRQRGNLGTMIQGSAPMWSQDNPGPPSRTVSDFAQLGRYLKNVRQYRLAGVT